MMYGDLQQLDDGRWQLRFTRTLRHPPEQVWRAITEPECLAAWFPTTIDGEREAGAPLRFSFPAGQAPAFDGVMIAYEPPSLMELRWGPDLIRVELRAVEQGTELTLLDTLEQLGKAARDGTGWHTCMDALEASLERERDPRENLDRWHELHPAYVERFGASAATIGVPEEFERQTSDRG
jgi:uncharacterized protein YndB with AHSA1/START domain